VSTPSVYVYAIARSGRADLSGVRGLADAPVERVVVGEIEAIVTRHDDTAAFEPSEETIVRHDAVCSALMAETPVAPSRFGSAFTDEAGIRSQLESRGDEFAAVLARLEGRVELGVRAVRKASLPGPPRTPSSGTEYLSARLAERQAALAAATEIDDRLAALAAARTSRMLETPGVLLSGSYLVERDAVDTFRAAVAALDRERADVTLVCTGPWPPYSFVDGAG